MKNFTLSLIIGLAAITNVFGQDLTQYERIYFSDPESIEGDDFILHAKNGVNQADHSKFAYTIENNTQDFIMCNPEEATFKFSFGEFHPSVKSYLVKPGDKKTKTMLAEGGDQFRVADFNFVTGGLYRIPVDGEKVEAPDFQLPASKNSFTVGNFEVRLRKYDASTREAKAQFEVEYTGDKMAIISPANLSVRAKKKKSEEEVVYANDLKKADIELMQKGDKVKFDAVFHIEGRIVDMQFATMFIVWNDTFVETSKEEIRPESFDFRWDETKTKESK